MQPTLTHKQQRVLDYLQRGIMQLGQTPSLRQTATDLGVSHAAIAQILKVLEDKGYVKREGRYSRTVYLLNRAQETAALQRWRNTDYWTRHGRSADVCPDGVEWNDGAGCLYLSRPKSFCAASERRFDERRRYSER